jgi:hypothetical protein
MADTDTPRHEHLMDDLWNKPIKRIEPLGGRHNDNPVPYLPAAVRTLLTTKLEKQPPEEQFEMLGMVSDLGALTVLQRWEGSLDADQVRLTLG